MGIVMVGSMAEYDQLLRTAGKRVVVIDFYATWCGPCRAVAPRVEELAKQYAQVGVFAKVDVDQARDVAQQCSIRAMPTFHVYLQGRQVEEVVGADISRLQAAIDRHAPKTIYFSGEGRTLGSGEGDVAAPQPSKPTKPTLKVEKKGAVDVSLLKQLTEMGFGRSLAEEALRESNSRSMAEAVDYISMLSEGKEETQPKKSSSSAASLTANAGSEIRGPLLLRLPDGSRMELEMSNTDTFRAVWDEIANRDPALSQRGFKLVQQYPNRTFTEAEWERELGTEKLIPRGQLRVVQL